MKSCNVEVLVMEILCQDTLKCLVTFLSNQRNPGLSMTHFGMALSAQHGSDRNFCYWSAVFIYTATQAAHGYLTEIAEWSLILGAREFQFWGGLDK